MSNNCTADLDHPCDGGLNGEPCARCAASEAYWRSEWERYGRAEVANRYTAEDVKLALSHPAERAKRDSLLAGIER